MQDAPSEIRSSAPRLRSLKDRVRQVALFELFGVLAITPPFAWASGTDLKASALLLALMALIAALWNGVYGTLFDWCEWRCGGGPSDRRPQHWRVVHALGLEAGLLLLTLPLVMVWTGLGLYAALIADIGLALVYVLYAWLFNLAYDRVFPLPVLGDK